jgi:hypothetical protein
MSLRVRDAAGVGLSAPWQVGDALLWGQRVHDASPETFDSAAHRLMKRTTMLRSRERHLVPEAVLPPRLPSDGSSMSRSELGNLARISRGRSWPAIASQDAVVVPDIPFALIEVPEGCSLLSPGRCCVRELGECVHGPAPYGDPVVVTSGHRFVGSGGTFFERLVAIALEHRLGSPPNVDLRDHALKLPIYGQ